MGFGKGVTDRLERLKSTERGINTELVLGIHWSDADIELKPPETDACLQAQMLFVIGLNLKEEHKAFRPGWSQDGTRIRSELN